MFSSLIINNKLIIDSMLKSTHCYQNVTDLKDRHFLPSGQLRATLLFTYSSNLGKSQLQVQVFSH